MVVNFPLASKSARRQIILQKINESFCWSEKEQLVEASQGLTVGELKDSLAALGDYSNQWRWLQITWQRKREWRMDDLMHLGIRILFPNQLRDEAPFSCHLYGLESIIKQLDIMLNDHHRPPHILSNMRGILFYGPPGTGKTSLAKNIAYSVRATFLSVDVSNLIDSYVGESERLLRMLFRQAKEMAPCVVFLDEVDSLFNTRQRSPDMPLMRWRSSFILEMDDFKQNEVRERDAFFPERAFSYLP